MQRRRGGQPGNQNALRHGRWSKSATTARKLSVARVKALGHVAYKLGMLIGGERFRIASVRQEQLALIQSQDPELFAVMLSLGLTERRVQTAKG